MQILHVNDELKVVFLKVFKYTLSDVIKFNFYKQFQKIPVFLINYIIYYTFNIFFLNLVKF